MLHISLIFSNFTGRDREEYLPLDKAISVGLPLYLIIGII